VKVGVGLPTSLEGVDGGLLRAWAEKADDGPFASLGVVDRMRYRCFEPMTTLALAASVTSRVELSTMVVIGPLRSPATLAKEAATVDGISGGRLTLGLAVGARDDDYLALGLSPRGRGDRLEDQLYDMRTIWERPETAALFAPRTGPRLLVGGASDVTFLRAARFADGYVHGGGPPRTFERAAGRVRTAWAEWGRTGAPALWAQGYFALGDTETIEQGLAYMRDYYAFTGPFAERIAEGLLATPQAVAQFVRGYAEAGCEHLVLLPAIAELDQLDRLADVLVGASK
jgi:alkanesulfonate monooxygenase SsuD/methylene tetrahydromethanopterin reductase-like flavin-dependent oxidoreductase (luciferase family)